MPTSKDLLRPPHRRYPRGYARIAKDQGGLAEFTAIQPYADVIRS
ncbi:hypothetical protein EBME_1856 [bacterium endosymbiont of Mortierella elongata FMR23-6]|nr:hypothetical protein EBME_1856 [bacterium endosymbiont of Mortierella elongata FMR23-6]